MRGLHMSLASSRSSARTGGRHSTLSLLGVAALAFAAPIAWNGLTAGAGTVPRPVGSGTDEPTEVATLQDELRRLRAEWEQWQAPAHGAADRSEAAPADAVSPASAAAVEAVGPRLDHADLLDLLMADLASQLAAGTLAASYAEQPAQLAAMVFAGWLDSGRTDRALALLRRLPAGTVDTESIARLANDLVALHDTNGAREVFLTGLRDFPGDRRFVAGIANVDPEAGLAMLRQGRSLDPEAAIETGAAELELLLAARHTEEAEALLQQLRAREPLSAENGLDASWIPALLERAPKQLLALLADQGPAANHLRVAAHRAAGDSAAVTATLREIVGGNPGDAYAWNQLAEIDLEDTLQRIERVEQDPHGELASCRAQMLIRAGRTEEARGVLMTLAERNWGQAAYGLLQVAPEWAVAQARQRRDDEVLGDAADQAWQRGDHQAAEALWREAMAFDRNDSEWSGKLRRLRLGRDPLSY